MPEVCDRTKPALKADTKTIAIGVAETQGWVLGFCEAMKIDKQEILLKQDTS